MRDTVIIADPLCLLRIKGVMARTGLSQSKVYELVARGKFPKAHKLEGTMSVWRSDEITEWVDRVCPRRAS